MIGWDLTGHTNIINTRSFGEWPDGQLFVVLDREGPSLHDILGQLRGQFAVIHLITEHILNALAHLQSKRIIHGDISTSNILLGRDGNAKLSDFGLSRRADTSGVARVGAHLAGLVGVPAYASPETLNGGPPTFASDLYSLGAVLHELAAGRPPHGSYDFTEMVMRVQLDPPGHLPSNTPDALAKLIRGLTEKDPAQRPSIDQAHAILAQDSRPHADRPVIAEISNNWVGEVKKKRGLDSPGNAQSDLLDLAAHHLMQIRLAEKPPSQPTSVASTEPESEFKGPSSGQYKSSRWHSIASGVIGIAIVSLLLFMNETPSPTRPEAPEPQAASIGPSTPTAEVIPMEPTAQPAEHAKPVASSEPANIGETETAKSRTKRPDAEHELDQAVTDDRLRNRRHRVADRGSKELTRRDSSRQPGEPAQRPRSTVSTPVTPSAMKSPLRLRVQMGTAVEIQPKDSEAFMVSVTRKPGARERNVPSPRAPALPIERHQRHTIEWSDADGSANVEIAAQ